MNDEHKHTCDCGSPAIKKKGNAFVCAKCDRIEKQMYGTRNRRVMHDAPKEELSFADAAFAH